MLFYLKKNILSNIQYHHHTLNLTYSVQPSSFHNTGCVVFKTSVNVWFQPSAVFQYLDANGLNVLSYQAEVSLLEQLTRGRGKMHIEYQDSVVRFKKIISTVFVQKRWVNTEEVINWGTFPLLNEPNQRSFCNSWAKLDCYWIRCFVPKRRD